MQLELAGFDLRQIEKVGDELEEMLAADVNVLGVLAVLVRAEETEALVHEDVGEADDGVQGRAQLVAHPGEELRLRGVGGLGVDLQFVHAPLARPQPLLGLVMGAHVADGALERIGREPVLVEVVAGAGVERSEVDVVVAVAGEQDHRRRRQRPAGIADEVEARTGADAVVDEGDVELLRADGLDRGIEVAAIGADEPGVAGIAQELPDPHVAFAIVVDDEHVGPA